jgi:hypothetical protein
VRAEVLDTISRFYIPLGSRLEECLQNLVLALLPGLEEESGEHFEKCMAVFENITKTIPSSQLLEKMWASMLISHKHRLAVVNYFGKIQSRKLTEEKADAFCAGQPSLVVSALGAALTDKNALVVRGVLDIISNHFPLSCTWIDKDQKIRLAQAVLVVLTRRDMSLNRRVFAWILGDPSAGDEPEATSVLGTDTLISAILSMLSDRGDDFALPYKIMSYLNDKPSIMNAILPSTAVYLIQALGECCDKQSAGFDKALISAKQLFSVVCLKQVWAALITTSLDVRGSKFCTFVDFFTFGVDNLPICEDEASFGYLPIFLVLLCRSFLDYQQNLTSEELVSLFKLSASTIGSISSAPRESAIEFTADWLDKVKGDLPILPDVFPQPADMVAFISKSLFELARRSASLALNRETNLLFVDHTVSVLDALMKPLPNDINRDGANIVESVEFSSFVMETQNAINSIKELELIDKYVRLTLKIRAFAIQASRNKPEDRDTLYVAPILDHLLSVV